MVVGGLFLKGFLGIQVIQGPLSTMTLLRGISIHYHMFRLSGLSLEEILMKNMHPSGILEEMLSHIMRWITMVFQQSTMTLILFINLISFMIITEALRGTMTQIITVIMDMIGKIGLAAGIGRKYAMTINCGIMYLIKAGKIVVIEIMIMTAIVMILTMKEARGMVVGEGVDLMIVSMTAKVV